MNTSNIELITKNIHILDTNREKIVNTWLSAADVQKILLKHDVNIKMFSTTYAHPVVNYFIGVIQGSKTIGNCPVISKLLEYLKDKEISSAELFIICINFRKSMINLLFQNHLMSEEMYENISYIFDANFRGVLEAFTDTISKAKAESKHFYDIATKDHLTQIYNRQKFDEMLTQEIQKAQAGLQLFSLILIDIDFFKQVNDIHGHEVGDSVLCTLVEIVKQHIREFDIFARWGGEEFIILIPKATKENTMQKAENIRKSIETHPFKKVGKVTASFGVTQYKELDTESSIFRRCDEALYKSKANGRNRVSSL